MPRRVRVYFDFISPYSYLALTRLAEFGARHGVEWAPAPVFYAALLNANALVGPAETRVKRRYTLTDVLRAAVRNPALRARLGNTVSLTTINTGIKVNVIPAEASATLDCRLLPDVDVDAFRLVPLEAGA